MADKLKEIPGKILEWWNKFTNKQKTIMVASVSVVIFTIAIITYTFTRPQYIQLGSYDTSADAAEVIEILNEAGITHRESADARTIEVLKSQESQANYALGAAGYTPDSFTYASFAQISMSTTSADREAQYNDYLQAEMANAIKATTPVKNVVVLITRPDQTGTLSSAAQQQDVSVAITVEVTDEFTSANAMAMAKFAAASLGNTSTKNIVIVDQNYNILFDGSNEVSSSAIAGDMQELKNQQEAQMNSQLKRVLLGTGQFNMVDVSAHLSVDFATYEKYIKEYYSGDGSNRGMVEYEDLYSSESTSGVSGIPGADSNGGNLTDYYNPDNNNSESAEQESSIHYQNNVAESTSSVPPGTVDYANSSASVAMIRYHIYRYEDVKAQGLLDGVSWAEFKAAHRDDVKLEVDDDYYRMVANASGISLDKITIIAYESPIFYDKEGWEVSGTDVLSIVMIVLILALLAFVILRTMGFKKKAEKTEEEELPSLDSLVQSTSESTLEDIDTETKSETRKLVDKFVDENPEAAANLLRNWLNEDWA